MTNYEEAMRTLQEKFGNQDALISLSTIALTGNADGKPVPAARLVSVYYEDGCFYTVTYATTAKVQQITQNPEVAICYIVENFTANGIAENLGWVCDEKNKALMDKIRPIFAGWYDDANNDSDPYTVLVRIRLTKGLWNDAHKGIREELDFVNKTAETFHDRA